jgi:hypothetical protein
MAFGSSGLSEAQFAAIGKVACEWSHLEYTLKYYIASIGKIDDYVAPKITAGLQGLALQRLALTILHDPDVPDASQPPLYQHVAALIARMDELRGKRNKIVHLDWTVGDAPGIAAGIWVKQHGKLSIEQLNWSIKDIESIALEIKALNDLLWQHILDFEDGRLAPLPAKP